MKFYKQPFEDTSATFIRSISYRSAEHGRFTEIYKSIVELKKNVAKRYYFDI